MITMLDVINSIIEEEQKGKLITRKEFAEAMRSGDEERKIEAVEKMEAAGGYDNLEDE